MRRRQLGKELRRYREDAGLTIDRAATLIGFESAATVIRDFEPTVVPGLLQTEEYARASLLRGQLPHIVEPAGPTSRCRSCRSGAARTRARWARSR